MQTALDNTNGIEVSAMLALWQNIKTDRLENYQSTCLSMTHWQPESKISSSLEFGSSLFMASIYGDDEDVNDSGDDDDDDDDYGDDDDDSCQVPTPPPSGDDDDDADDDSGGGGNSGGYYGEE